jgi:4-hydroxybenzoate polyprenyltransferase
MVSARTLAMASNRLLDARLDAQNPRTACRAIPSGALSPGFYGIIAALCVGLFFAATAGFWLLYRNPWPIVFAAPILAFLSAYPLLKRFTRLCHYYLGAALALAPVCAWIAIRGRIDLPPVWMAAAVACWTAGFDIIYAWQAGFFPCRRSLALGQRCGSAESRTRQRWSCWWRWVCRPGISARSIFAESGLRHCC